MQYEYRSKIKGETIVLDQRLTDEQMDERQLKRVYSLGFQIKSVDWGH